MPTTLILPSGANNSVYERLDLTLELYFNGTVATLEEAEQEATLLFDDLAQYASAYDAVVLGVAL